VPHCDIPYQPFNFIYIFNKQTCGHPDSPGYGDKKWILNTRLLLKRQSGCIIIYQRITMDRVFTRIGIHLLFYWINKAPYKQFSQNRVT